jgi:EipB-like
MRVPACLAALALLTMPGLIAPGAPSLVPRAATAAPVPVRAPAPLAAHRALYQLTLVSARRGREITDASGTMGYEVADVCDGWTTRQRLRMTLSTADGTDTEMDSDYATWESKDGLRFRFHMVQTTDGSISDQTDGSAHLTRTGGVGEVMYRLPKPAKVRLPAGTLFPMMHTLAVINAAREGKKFLTLPLFDGTDDDGLEDSSIVVLDWKPPFATKYPMLNHLPSTRVRLAFFDHGPEGQTPTYGVAMRYWENGVADDMLMDFGDFVMHATLTELRPLPRKC